MLQIYTPYRVAKRSWMAGGNEATCAAHPAASCCLKPCKSCWNIEFNSGDGWFHLTIELQNQSKLCYMLLCQITTRKTFRKTLTLAIPAGFVCTKVQSPRNAESFSSLSRISYSAWHHACANSGRCGATSAGCINPILPIDTAAFSCRLRGAFGCKRIGISLEISGLTHC